MVRVIKTKSVVERTEKHLSDVVLLTELFTDVVKEELKHQLLLTKYLTYCLAV